MIPLVAAAWGNPGLRPPAAHGPNTMKHTKDKMVSFRLKQEEMEALESILNYSGLPARSQSTVLRLAIPFIEQSIRAGIARGATDHRHGRPFDQRHERFRNPDRFDFVALGYNLGYRGDHAMQYRAGKAQGEADHRNHKPNALGGPLAASASRYAVGYFDGYRGGYLSGLAKGEADRESARESAGGDTAREHELYRPPEDDPEFRSNFAIGYRTGFRSKDLKIALGHTVGLSFEAYQKASFEGSRAWQTGKPYRPAVPDGVEPDEHAEMLWADGWHDGYHGGWAAGMREGEADRDNGKSYEPPSGRGALSDFAIGYRTACRPVAPLTNTDEDRIRRAFAEYEDGRSMGLAHRRDGLPSIDQIPNSPLVAGYHAYPYSPFASGYRAGYGPQHREMDFLKGSWEAWDDRDNSRQAKDYRSDSPRDAGYRAEFHGIVRRLNEAEARNFAE